MSDRYDERAADLWQQGYNKEIFAKALRESAADAYEDAGDFVVDLENGDALQDHFYKKAHQLRNAARAKSEGGKP